MLAYKRVLLKLSGEALAGPNKTGFHEETVQKVALQVKELVDKTIIYRIWTLEDGEFDEEISFYEGLLISVTLEFVIKTIKEAVISSVAYKMGDYGKNFHSSESVTEITLKKPDDNSYVFVGHDGLNDAA